MRLSIIRGRIGPLTPANNEDLLYSVRGLGPSLQFSISRALHQVLRAGTWASQTTFTKAYLRTFTVKYLDKFSLELGPVVAAQSVVTCEKKTASTSSCERN